MESERFGELVHDALTHFHDRAYLQTHPLARLLLAGPFDSKEGARLQRLLLETLDELKPQLGGGPGRPEWRRQRYLYLRYVEGLTHERVVQQLDISHRQGHRDHHEALNALVNLLRPLVVANEKHSSEPVPSSSKAGSQVPGAERLLEAELLKLDRAGGHAPTDLAAVLAAALETVSELATLAQIRLRSAVEPGLPPVVANKDALRQALLNLLSYVLERHAGQVIESRATFEEGGVCLSLVNLTVAPSRGGPSNVEANADPRLHACQRLIELQGGSLDLLAAASTQPGVIARLRLPAAKPASLLLIDDDPDFAQLVQRYLRGHPYQVLVATNAQRALELARTGEVELVVLDVLMPTQDGWEILRELRRLPPTCDVPVVLCSVLADWALARSLGATSLLAKPVTQRSLLDALRECSASQAANRAFPGGSV